MSKSRLRFFGPLNDLLKPSMRFRPIEISTLERRSVKDAVEALGVPHTEIDLITVDGESVGFDHLIGAGERICVYPHFSSLDITNLTRVRPPALMKHRFVVDVHLGRLARRLRLLGFDTLYRNDWNDAELARCSEQEGRILLSQDRGLLKRRRVRHGQLVRAHEPDRQLEEVIERFDLRPEISPFRRCPLCNTSLRMVAREEVAARLPPRTRAAFEEFRECRSCGRLYWKGAHHRRLGRLLERLGSQPGTTS
jgi:uncharacterized protein with PIN domain